MAEYLLYDCLPDLKELENKTGRQIPASLLIWMKDSKNPEDGWKSDVLKREHSGSVCDSFSDKINNLKQEMMWLRSADVKILRQLMAVHEGIEAMRWLMMEERGALTSRGSSLTGSLSSLVTVEEQGPSMSPCRKSPTFPQDLNCETSTDLLLLHSTYDCDDSNHQSYYNKESAMRIPHGVYDQSSGNDWAKANVGTCASQDSDDVTPHKMRKDGANILRRALLRTSKGRESQSEQTGSSAQAQSPVHPGQESLLPGSQTNTKEEKETTLDNEKLLLGYDAQWCWVESQDDVTFL
ncbi:leucine rich adaptor protein 1-like [Gouania willdenowi]|uniref:Leucine rich adaptor protein 1-like n=1 Tax=Gouania willdenowi TaxID=441366 RepID=A0A8C5H772_GOUWI|nr:leucine rich adaptor protein 1-like [Gouania willdenowi]